MPSLQTFLERATWMAGLTPGQRDRVFAEVVQRDVPAGSYVCRKGEAVEYWFGVIEGLVKLSSDSPEGRSATFTGVPGGGWFGEGSLLKREPRRYDGVALRRTSVACLPRTTFECLFQESLSFSHFLVLQLNERCGQMIAMLECDRTMDRDARVARCISGLFNPFLYPGVEAHIEIKQAEIAHLCGISRQHANMALHRLESSGLLRVDYRGITVVDLAGLHAFAR
jgi:CRP-like cAMP-binding protein